MSCLIRRALSLVEVLVVTAIIVVLASLLLPGIKVVQESARTAQCLGNMRQIGMAQTGFAQDSRGYVCPADGYGWWDESRYWNRTLADYTDDDAARQYRSDHISSVSWGCPSWTRRQEYIEKATRGDYWSFLYTGKTSGYALNGAFQSSDVNSPDKLENGWWYIDNNHYYPVDGTATARWNDRSTTPFLSLTRLVQISYPSRQSLVVDGYLHFAHPWYQAYADPLGRSLVIERHRGKGSCLFVDGHTGLVTGEEWARSFWRPDL